jgi:hypothetical protein
MKSCFASSVRFHKSVQCSQDRCDGVVSDRFFCTTSINVLVSKLYMVHGRYKEQRALTYLDTPQWHSPQNYFLSQFRCPLNFVLMMMTYHLSGTTILPFVMVLGYW